MKIKLSRLLCLVLCAVMLCGMMTGIASAASTASGTCGENVSWSFEEATGTLTISGTGPMDSYPIVPWYEYADQVTRIVYEDGITEICILALPVHSIVESITLPNTLVSIPNSAFTECRSLKALTIPESVTSIGMYAFYMCTSLRELTIPASVTSIASYGLSGGHGISEFTFQADAPEFGTDIFLGITATVYYPAGNETWTEAVRQNYGGNITWVPYGDGAGELPAEIETTPMYRLYNPNTGEHFYTGSMEERIVLTVIGWKYEGVAWNAPVREGEPVYRVFNIESGDHHYTMSQEEVDVLVDLGWTYEGVAWNSASAENIPQYRLYNPNAALGSHHYTSSMEERETLVSLGWKYEGIGWFGLLK